MLISHSLVSTSQRINANQKKEKNRRPKWVVEREKKALRWNEKLNEWKCTSDLNDITRCHYKEFCDRSRKSGANKLNRFIWTRIFAQTFDANGSNLNLNSLILDGRRKTSTRSGREYWSKWKFSDKKMWIHMNDKFQSFVESVVRRHRLRKHFI